MKKRRSNEMCSFLFSEHLCSGRWSWDESWRLWKNFWTEGRTRFERYEYGNIYGWIIIKKLSFPPLFKAYIKWFILSLFYFMCILWYRNPMQNIIMTLTAISNSRIKILFTYTYVEFSCTHIKICDMGSKEDILNV